MGDSDPESSANPKIENKASDEAAATTTAAAAAVANDSISEEELSIREWLASLFSEPKFTATDPRVSLQTLLGDGVLVCQLANKIKKGSVARINPPNALRFMLVVCPFVSFSVSFIVLNLMLFVVDRKTFVIIAKHVETLVYRNLLCLSHSN